MAFMHDNIVRLFSKRRIYIAVYSRQVWIPGKLYGKGRIWLFWHLS